MKRRFLSAPRYVRCVLVPAMSLLSLHVNPPRCPWRSQTMLAATV